MIEKPKRADIRFVDAWATFSDDRVYRYDLGRRWDPDRPMLGWCCLNPSSAGADDLDPTTWRIVEFSMKFGYGGFWLANAYALVSTDPKALQPARDPVGPENDAWIEKIVLGTTGMVAAWGTGIRRDRAYDVRMLLERARRSKPGEVTSLWCLRMTKGKLPQPEHPLYLPAACERLSFA